jgi:hypothetical protein
MVEDELLPNLEKLAASTIKNSETIGQMLHFLGQDP